MLNSIFILQFGNTMVLFESQKCSPKISDTQNYSVTYIYRYKLWVISHIILLFFSVCFVHGTASKTGNQRGYTQIDSYHANHHILNTTKALKENSCTERKQHQQQKLRVFDNNKESTLKKKPNTSAHFENVECEFLRTRQFVTTIGSMQMYMPHVNETLFMSTIHNRCILLHK